MAACNRLKRGNILAWEKSSWILNNVPIEDIQDPAHFCAGLRQYVIFPEKTKFLEAQKICEVHGGNLAVPKSAEDSEIVLGIVSKHSNQCIAKTIAEKDNAAWIGARKISNRWYAFNTTNAQGSLLNYTNVPEATSISNSDCSVLRKDGVWKATKNLAQCSLFVQFVRSRELLFLQ